MLWSCHLQVIVIPTALGRDKSLDAWINLFELARMWKPGVHIHHSGSFWHSQSRLHLASLSLMWRTAFKILIDYIFYLLLSWSLQASPCLYFNHLTVWPPRFLIYTVLPLGFTACKGLKVFFLRYVTSSSYRCILNWVAGFPLFLHFGLEGQLPLFWSRQTAKFLSTLFS